MRTVPVMLALTLFTNPDALLAQNTGSEASSTAIHEVVSGKKCVGDDFLIFGESDSGASGSYERVGRAPGAYQIGYGTILIVRGRELHSHVATVSVPDHMLYMSTEKYRCGP